MEAWEIRPGSGRPAWLDAPELLRRVALVAQAYTVVAFGLLGFGLILFGGPGLLIVILAGSTRAALEASLALALAGALIVVAILAATLLVRIPIDRGHAADARTPALALAVGDLGVSLLGGLLSFNVLAGIGGLGALLFLATFYLIDRSALPAPGEPTPVA